MTEGISTGTIKQIEEWSDKAAKYDHMKQRYLKYAEDVKLANAKLKEVQVLLDAVMKDIDPISALKEKGERLPRVNVMDKIEEQYKKLTMGLPVTLESIKKDYPELDEQRVTYIFYQKLSYSPKVLKRKEFIDGKSVTTLYMQKEI